MASRSRGLVRLSLKFKFSILVVLLLSVVFSITGFGMVRKNVEEVLGLIEQRGHMLTSMQAESLAAPLWSVDLPQVEAVLKAMQRDPAFAGARVLSPDGKTVMQIGDLSAADRLGFAEPIVKDGEALGRLELALSRRSLDESRAHNLLTTAAVLGAVLAAILIGFLVLLGFIFRPLGRIQAAMMALAQGRLDTAIPGLERQDELGSIARTVLVFRQNAIDKAQAEAETSAAKQLAEDQRRAATRHIADEFEAVVGKIVETVSSASDELETTAGTLTQSADSTQQLSTAVALASEQASANVQSVASATNQMISSVNEISRQVNESARIAGEAVKQAEKTDARILELSRAASRIGDVVKLITAIAEQTNLLALNATIEAARAGESGRGFAVVANEVKALAAQTSKATGEIGAQISGMQAATQDSVTAIKEIGGTIERIAEIASTIAAAVEEQGAATGEIARNVDQAARGTTEVASNITHVNRGARETGSASSQVLSSAQALAGESGRLKLEVGKFLQTVRAA